MFKKLLCFSAAFILCLTSFIVPSFADSTFPNQPIQGSDFIWASVSGSNRLVYSSQITVDLYCFIVSSTNNLYLVCPDQSLSVMIQNDNNGGYTQSKTFLLNSTYNYYVGTYNFNLTSPNFYVPNFDSFDSGMSALSDFIINGDSSSYPLLYDYDLPNGNVAYIEAANTGDTITITATFPQQSTLFSDSWTPMTMKYNWAPVNSSGVLTIHTSFPYNGQIDLPLVKSGYTNLLGQSNTGSCSFTQIASNRLEIYNPSYRQVNASNQDQYLLNPTLHIHCDSGFIALSVYPLKESLTPGGISSISDPSDVMILQHTEDSTPEDPQSEWVGADTTSSTNPPIPGGNNELPETFTIGDYINKLHDTLSNFAKSVISLLEQPIEHIGDLIQAGSGFMGALRGIYAWLPVDIQGIVISALTVIIGIGVFKVFL